MDFDEIDDLKSDLIVKTPQQELIDKVNEYIDTSRTQITEELKRSEEISIKPLNDFQLNASNLIVIDYENSPTDNIGKIMIEELTKINDIVTNILNIIKDTHFVSQSHFIDITRIVINEFKKTCDLSYLEKLYENYNFDSSDMFSQLIFSCENLSLICTSFRDKFNFIEKCDNDYSSVFTEKTLNNHNIMHNKLISLLFMMFAEKKAVEKENELIVLLSSVSRFNIYVKKYTHVFERCSEIISNISCIDGVIQDEIKNDILSLIDSLICNLETLKLSINDIITLKSNFPSNQSHSESITKDNVLTSILDISIYTQVLKEFAE